MQHYTYFCENSYPNLGSVQSVLRGLGPSGHLVQLHICLREEGAARVQAF